MPESSLFLNEPDARAVVRLLADVAARGGELNDKRARLMRGLAELVEADKWVWAMASIDNAERLPVVLQAVHEGFSADEAAAFAEEGHIPDDQPPEQWEAVNLIETRQRWTRRRDQLVSDEAWYEPRNVARHKRMGFEDLIWSHYPLQEPGTYSIMGLHREWGRPRFTERETRIVALIATEVDWLHFDQPAEPDAASVGELPPRLRTVLTLLLNGFDRSMIAAELKLSEHTVADYVKQVFRHFSVRGQLELMRAFFGPRALK